MFDTLLTIDPAAGEAALVERIATLERLKSAAAAGQACNYLKETPGWSVRTDTGDHRTHTAEHTTPTGATYHSTAPPVTVGIHLAALAAARTKKRAA
jgi:hypothetical protein